MKNNVCTELAAASRVILHRLVRLVRRPKYKVCMDTCAPGETDRHVTAIMYQTPDGPRMINVFDILAKYERALIVLSDERGDTYRHEVEKLVTDDAHWKKRREDIGRLESWDGQPGQVAWKEFPNA